ncbi:MAG: DinB family protein [Planctomycetota bacterium]
MNAKEAIRSAFNVSDMVLQSYIGDLSDAELMSRPGKGCNHIAWQLGHLISSEANLVNMLKDGSAVELPAGFVEAHDKTAIDNNEASQFQSKDEYLELYNKTRQNSLAVIGELTEEQLSAETPEHFREFCPTNGDLAILIATHPMMHAGQFVPVRRSLDKPVVI